MAHLRAAQAVATAIRPHPSSDATPRGPRYLARVRVATPQARIRQTTRLLAAGAWTGGCYLLWAPGALLSLPSRHAARRWNAVATRTWARGLLRIFGVRLAARGTAPPSPAFLVANHLSWVDILVLGAHLGPTFVSKHEIARWPLLGHLSRVTGTIFVDRGRRRDTLRVLREIDRAIDEGATVLLFPEGTSSRGGAVRPLKPALLEWAVQRDYPVHAVALGYTTGDPDLPAEETVCWWDDRPFAAHALGFLSLPRVEARLVYGAAPVRGTDRQQLAATLHRQLSEQHDDARS